MRKILLGTLVLCIGAAALFIMVPANSRLLPECEPARKSTTVQSHRSYQLALCSNMNNIQPGTKTTLEFMVRNDQGKTVKNFAVTHEKIMHLIVIRHDLQYFQHVHPTYDQDSGIFTTDITFPTDGPYRIFPDFVPGKSEGNVQSLAVTLDRDIQVGDMSNYKAVENKPDNESAVLVDGYVVNFQLPSPFDLKPDADIMYGVSVRKDQKQVTDLEPYLGSLGHSVIVKDGSLDFIHTHALEGGGLSAANETMEHGMHHAGDNTMNTSPQISFATRFPEPGIYKIYVQFQHRGRVVTADRTVEVR